YRAPVAEVGPQVFQPAPIRHQRCLRLDDHQVSGTISGRNLEDQAPAVTARARLLDPRIDDRARHDHLGIHYPPPPLPSAFAPLAAGCAKCIHHVSQETKCKPVPEMLDKFVRNSRRERTRSTVYLEGIRTGL